MSEPWEKIVRLNYVGQRTVIAMGVLVVVALLLTLAR